MAAGFLPVQGDLAWFPELWRQRGDGPGGGSLRPLLLPSVFCRVPLMHRKCSLERGSSKSFQEIGLITQQPLGVGAVRVEFSGSSAAASTSQASAKSCSVQENPKAALTLEPGKVGEGGGGGEGTSGHRTQTLNLPLLAISCSGSRDLESTLVPQGTELREVRSFTWSAAPREEQLQIPPRSDSKSVSWPLHSAPLLSTEL